jgi:DNA-binding transcriptional LysR family regulator
MDWDGLRFFLAVARAGRATQAAKRLGVDQTTVSRRLAALEAELGGALLYRTSERYRLTELGQAAFTQAEAMEQAVLSVRARSKSGSSASGRVRLALLDEFSSHWLAPKLPEFRAEYPDIELLITTGIPPVDISHGDADLAIRTPRPKQAGLATTRLGTTYTALYASKRLVGKQRMLVEDLASARGLPLLVYAPEYHSLQAAAWFQPILLQSKLALVTNSSHTLVGAARAGLGLAVLPTFMSSLYKDLVCVSDILVEGEHWLVLHPEFRRDPKVRALAGFLKRVARGPGGLDDGVRASPPKKV